MKVLLINGSPKEKGNTFQALSEVARTLNAEDIETEIVSIGKQAVQGCVACGWCGRMGKCTYNDDLYYKVWRAVKDGIDGLVVGSPVYYGGPNGSLLVHPYITEGLTVHSARCSIGYSILWGNNCSTSRQPVLWYVVVAALQQHLIV